MGVKELNLALYKNNQVIAKAPLLIKKKYKKQLVYLRGHFTAACTLDFIYKQDLCYDDFKFLLDSIRSLLGNVSFLFDRVAERTLTYEYLKKYFALGRVEKEECVSIPLPQSYDDWLKSLHRSTRSNVTLYRNRLERHHVNWFVDFCCRDVIDNDTAEKMMEVYVDRFLVKNNFHFGPLRKLVVKILLAILLRDKVTNFLNHSKNSFHAVLYMNNEIAAFTSGVICKDKRILFCRLSIATKYAKYGPGGVILSSMIQYVIEQNQNGNLDIDQLDLSAGVHGGMAYKLAFGGKEYYRYHFMD